MNGTCVRKKRVATKRSTQTSTSTNFLYSHVKQIFYVRAHVEIKRSKNDEPFVSVSRLDLCSRVGGASASWYRCFDSLDSNKGRPIKSTVSKSLCCKVV